MRLPLFVRQYWNYRWLVLEEVLERVPLVLNHSNSTCHCDRRGAKRQTMPHRWQRRHTGNASSHSERRICMFGSQTDSFAVCFVGPARESRRVFSLWMNEFCPPVWIERGMSNSEFEYVLVMRRIEEGNYIILLAGTTWLRRRTVRLAWGCGSASACENCCQLIIVVH